ncbi:MAG: sel1 repeat family protein [Rhodospirillaceae bacterium]|nr:sel1 repeat family protein [Rhodospirillaceae bacterium]
MEKRTRHTAGATNGSESKGGFFGGNRTRMATTVLALLIALGLGFQIIARRDELVTAPTVAKVTDCDRLAAHPSDTQKLSPGVEQPKVDIPAAKKACHAALTASPGDGRILYQLGRSYFYNDEKDQGIAYFKQSDTAGYAQGQFVLGLIYSQGNGIEPDMCEAGRLWVKAARQRHLYSKIFLANNWMDGLFADCALEITEQELDGMVSQAAELADTQNRQDDVAMLRENWDKRKR